MACAAVAAAPWDPRTWHLLPVQPGPRQSPGHLLLPQTVLLALLNAAIDSLPASGCVTAIPLPSTWQTPPFSEPPAVLGG